VKERDIEAAFVKYAKTQGAVAYKFTSPGRRGVPDRLVVTPHGVFFVEFKQPGKKPTALQAREHEKLRAFGLPVLVADGKGQAEEFLDLFLETQQL